MASAIIFFAGATPPNPTAFLSGTLCSATLSFAVLTCASRAMGPVAAQGAAAGTLLMWYKAIGVGVFPPAAVLAGLLTAKSLSGTTASSLGPSLRYLCFPWLAGHAWLFSCALATSEVRSRARVFLTTRQLAAWGDQTDEALKSIFNTFDTSGDGTLDVDELKVALRVALGLDLSRSDCEQVVAVADRDGDGQ
eukprot:CAMPEP_0181223234 /NCGR_PEP_ID=MMETSP1096-20121128/30400_1 /TAXON_ID=156174 ORGANISM="Chrysochromulina ericina, Strain CCMP281" /NCGR_SAMPLE_ID=MMETSP1096 /ASSEMBLY_ACC=CAM_ASM_000453 /LENGTH=192 /DNA_ID=CAMNT_0023316067 /DNA_START=375 /DNA_END=950 /DNA_ORIENTATION=+